MIAIYLSNNMNRFDFKDYVTEWRSKVLFSKTVNLRRFNSMNSMSLLELIFIAIVQFHRKIYNIILAEFILSRDVRCYQKLAINVEILVKCFIKV